jgi:hypothetical protein
MDNPEKLVTLGTQNEEKQDLDIHCLMLLGAYQILHSNIAQHASIYETVNIADGLDKRFFF